MTATVSELANVSNFTRELYLNTGGTIMCECEEHMNAATAWGCRDFMQVPGGFVAARTEDAAEIAAEAIWDGLEAE